VPFGQPSTDNWFIKTGMGNFVASLAVGLPIQYNTEVLSVDHSGAGVTVTTSGGTIKSQAVIVTSSVGVLQSGRPNFSPALPAPYIDAIQNMQMGAVGKVGFEFSADIFGPITTTTALLPLTPPGSDDYSAMFAKFYGENMMYVLMGGPSCREAEQGGEAGMIEYARAAVASVLGPEVLPLISRTAAHSWLNDPWALGAYSTASPGHVSARIQLQTPINHKIFFAGEGVALEGGASMGGAFVTGQQAVHDFVGA
jgi:monoamine oxidase